MSIEWDYLNEYKAAEKICRDMGYENGVSGYITDMEERAERGRFFVSDWDDEYYNLKHLRWLRNQIAHGCDKPYEVTSKDLIDIKRFRIMLLQSKDPLTVLGIGLKEYSRQPKPQRSAAPQPRSAPQANNGGSYLSNKIIAAIAILIAASLIGITVYSAFH